MFESITSMSSNTNGFKLNLSLAVGEKCKCFFVYDLIGLVNFIFFCFGLCFIVSPIGLFRAPSLILVPPVFSSLVCLFHFLMLGCTWEIRSPSSISASSVSSWFAVKLFFSFTFSFPACIPNSLGTVTLAVNTPCFLSAIYSLSLIPSLFSLNDAQLPFYLTNLSKLLGLTHLCPSGFWPICPNRIILTLLLLLREVMMLWACRFLFRFTTFIILPLLAAILLWVSPSITAFINPPCGSSSFCWAWYLTHSLY